PILERYRHFTVTRIMWKGDDTLRNLYTATKRKFDRLPDIKIEVIRKAFDQLHTLYDDMIFQEETFLIPVVKKLFTRDDWQAIQMESDAFGYAFEPEHPQTMTEDTIAQKNYPKENFKFGGGYL